LTARIAGQKIHRKCTYIEFTVQETVKPAGGRPRQRTRKVLKMFARVLAPIPLGIAVFLGATTAGPLISTAEAATPAARKEVVRQFKMSTSLGGGKMVYLDAQGKPNPVLRANVGDTVETARGTRSTATNAPATNCRPTTPSTVRSAR
jgi:hypothetical protein